jgi:hypothetical protein
MTDYDDTDEMAEPTPLFTDTLLGDPIEDELEEEDELPESHMLIQFLDDGNICEELPDNAEATADILEAFEEAEQSMKPWKDKYDRALHLAKLQPTLNGTPIKQKDFPFKNASLAMMPYITEAMLDFSARAAPELVWATDIVKVKVYGMNPPNSGAPESENQKQTRKLKEAQAERVATYQNYQLSEEIPNWRKSMDKGMFIIACPGTIYKETYYDQTISGVRSDLCLADEIVFNHDYPTFEEAPDKFKEIEYTRNEVLSFIRGEQQWKIEESKLDEKENKFKFIEAYTWIDMDEDGYKEPYRAVVCDLTAEIVFLEPYYEEEGIAINAKNEIIDVKPLDRFTQFQFLPDPDGGPMGLGWGILLGPMFDAINTNVRQLIDAGTVANTAGNSGFFAAGMATGRGNAIQSGPIQAKLGQITPISVRGDLRNNLVQFPAAGPNATLMQLMEYQIEAARRMTSVTANAEANPGEAQGLYLARLQQAMKNPNSIVMRVYESGKEEQRKIGALNFKHYSDEKYNRVLDDDQEQSMQTDYDPDTCDIRLYSDPAQGSDIERATRAHAILEEAKQGGGVITLRVATIDWLKSMKTPNIEELAPEPDPNYVDPTQKLILDQQAFEAELKKKDQELRSGELDVKRMKAAKEAASEQTKLGLSSDETEAKISYMYVQSLEKLVNMGLAEDQAMHQIDVIERKYIDELEAPPVSSVGQ